MLQLEHIGYEIDGKVILEDINLKIANEFVAITGPNGSGKSTLAKIIMGLCQPTSGRIIFEGEDITDLSIDERAKRGISYACQQPVRFKGLKVRDLLEIANNTGDKKAIYSALESVGLTAKEYLNRELDDTLSGGEMKRIEIAMNVLRQSRLSLFDEPEAGIDLWSFQSLIHLFEKMQKEIKGGILIISHQERILRIADQIIYLKDGKILEDQESIHQILSGGSYE